VEEQEWPQHLSPGETGGSARPSSASLANAATRVWLGWRDGERGRQAEAELRDEGLDVIYLPLDVADEASVKAAATIVAARTPILDALVNNAAISRELAPGAAQPYTPSEMPMANLRETFDTNFFGAVSVTQAFLPMIRAAKAGRIVNVSSGLGSFAFNTSRTDSLNRSLIILGYKTSKAALNMATVLFAHELEGTPIKVNAANPRRRPVQSPPTSADRVAARFSRVWATERRMKERQR
jgi:NAD(P)-dependent dehydrogenase (short-subunit alcohol dehydrogenase family)